MAESRRGRPLDVGTRNRMIRDTLKTLEFNKVSLGKSADELVVVENKLEKEYTKVKNEIDERSKNIKERLDAYIANLYKDLRSKHENNLRVIKDNKDSIISKLEKTEYDIVKCKEILNGYDPNTESRFSQEKVLELMNESISKGKFSQPSLELVRVRVEIGVNQTDIKARCEELLGVLKSMTETVGEVLYPGYTVKSSKIPEVEINALTIPRCGGDVWLNFGVSNELVSVNFESKTNNINWRSVVLAVKINDIAVGEDGLIYVTSPDSKSVKCLKTTKSNKYVKLFSIEDDLYLHGITTCEDTRRIAVCGTDTKNYSSDPPNEVVIIEFTTEGRELKRTAISGYSGKAYRIAQNIRATFVLTFPKEGLILSVNGKNGAILSRFDKEDFKLAKPKGVKGLGLEFWPSGVCCSSTGYVFVSEYVNKLVLMMDSELRLLRYINDKHVCPNALCFQNETNTLWIGDKGSIKVWKVM